MKRAGRWWVYGISPVDHGWEEMTPASIEDVPSEAREAARQLGWEGDVRGADCVRFWVPDEVDFIDGFIWKQDNNGSCFVVSPVQLPHVEGLELWSGEAAVPGVLDEDALQRSAYRSAPTIAG